MIVAGQTESLGIAYRQCLSVKKNKKQKKRLEVPLKDLTWIGSPVSLVNTPNSDGKHYIAEKSRDFGFA